MSDQSKKRCPSQDSDSLNPSTSKRTKVEDKSEALRRTTDGARNLVSKASSSSAGGSHGKRKKKTKPHTTSKQSEYDDTGWCAPSEFTKQVAGDRLQGTDPPKGCEEVLGLLSELTKGSTPGQTINAKFSFAQNQTGLDHDTPTTSAQTINKEDLASLAAKDEGGTPFESPSSVASPALVISTTPPKKSGSKKRKVQSTSTTPRSSQGKRKAPKTPDRSAKLLKIATRQLIHRTPSKAGFSRKKTQKVSSKDDSPRKSQRIASSDHRISWKKGKKTIKKVKRTEKKSSDSEEEDGEDESSDYELEFDSDLEARLEENAARNNLTAINVKSILHHVITNEHVLAMVRNTMQDIEEPQKPGTPEKTPAVYEPKLTRSKLKEVTEKVGSSAVAWPLTPVKNPLHSVPQFAEIDFPEDSSEDEDYKPSQEEITQVDESDYESVASSHGSNFGSPCPPGTPHSLNVSFEADNEISPHKTTPCTTPTPSKVVPHIPAATVPMGPPLSRPKHDRVNDDMRFLSQLDSFDAELKTIQANIANRTRSKNQINQTVQEIEASFMPPDIAHDMYDSDHEDKDDEWVAWLAGLNQPGGPESVDPPDDDQNDPEYNFLAEEETVDTEDFRDDKAVRVSKKELDELMDEIMEAYGNEVDLQQAAQALVPGPFNQPVTLSDMIAQQREAAAAGSDTSPVLGALSGGGRREQEKETSADVSQMSDRERQQLQQQMQQHVQLLCQTSVMARACGNMHREHNQAKKFLNELNFLAGNFEQAVFGATAEVSAQPLPYCSFFRTCNLKEACHIAEKPLPERDPEHDSTLRLQRHVSIPLPAADTYATSTVFMYPELIPLIKLGSRTKKLMFTDSEDNLIVYGLDQLCHLETMEERMKLIQEMMMPTKTVKQLCLHMKNMMSHRSGDNVVKLYRKHGVLNTPPVPCEPIAPGMGVAPSQLYENRKPDWLKKYMQLVNLRTTEEHMSEVKDTEKTVFRHLKPVKLPSQVEFTDEENKSKSSGKLVVHKMTRPPKKVTHKKNAKNETIIYPKGVPRIVASASVVLESDVKMVAQEDSALNQVTGGGQQVQYVTQQVQGATPRVADATQPVQGAMQVVQSDANIGPSTCAPPISAPLQNTMVIAPSGMITQQPLGAPNALPVQQPMIITVNPSQTNSGFQNRIPVSSQGKVGLPAAGQPMQMVYQQVAPQPVIRFQQPTLVFATPQSSAVTAPSIIIQSQPISTNVQQISPGGTIQRIINANNATAEPQGPQPIKILPKPRTTKRVSSDETQSGSDESAKSGPVSAKLPSKTVGPKSVKIRSKSRTAKRASSDETMSASDSAKSGLDNSAKLDARPGEPQPVKIRPKPRTNKRASSDETNSGSEESAKTGSDHPSKLDVKPEGPQPVKIHPKPRTTKRASSDETKSGLEESAKSGSEDPAAKCEDPAAKSNVSQKKQSEKTITQKEISIEGDVPKGKESSRTKQRGSDSNDTASQEEIDKANQLLEDVRKRISSGEEEKAHKNKGLKKKKRDTDRKKAKPKNVHEQEKATEETVKKLVESIKSLSDKEKQSSSGSGSGSSDRGSEEEEMMDASGYFPDMSPSPEITEEITKDKKVKSDEPNHDRQEKQVPSTVPDILSPSTCGASTPLTRRVLFQKSKEAGDESKCDSHAETEQMQGTTIISDDQASDNSNTVARLHVQDVKAIDETSNLSVASDWAKMVESQADDIDSKVLEPDESEESRPQWTENERQTDTNQDTPMQEQQRQISLHQGATESESLLNVGSPSAISGVQIQTSQTPSPPVHVQSNQIQTPTSVQSLNESQSVQTPTSVESPNEGQFVTVPNSRITFHSPPVSSFPPQPSPKDGTNTPSPSTHFNSSKSPKGISAFRRFKIGKGAVARQSPVTPQSQADKPKTARKLMEGDQSSAARKLMEGDQSSTGAQNSEQPQSPSTMNKQSQVSTVIASPSSILASVSQGTSQTVLQEVNPNSETDVQVSRPDVAYSSPENEDGKIVSSPSDILVCKEPVLSDDEGDELKPLSKEEEEFCEEEPMDEDDAEDEPMDEEDLPLEEVPADEDESSLQQVEIKSESPLADVTNSEVTMTSQQSVSPTASDKSTHSNVCTPPSNKAISAEPSPTLKDNGHSNVCTPPSNKASSAETSPTLKAALSNVCTPPSNKTSSAEPSPTLKDNGHSNVCTPPSNKASSAETSPTLKAALSNVCTPPSNKTSSAEPSPTLKDNGHSNVCTPPSNKPSSAEPSPTLKDNGHSNICTPPSNKASSAEPSPTLKDHGHSNVCTPPSNKPSSAEQSPTLKAAHSTVCTPPSNKASSAEPSPTLKGDGDDEEPNSPETEDALTSPETKSTRDDARRPMVTFEDSNSLDAFHSNSNTMDGCEEEHDGMDAENEDSNPHVPDGGKKKKSKSKKIAAKRIKTKLRQDMEASVEMLDPNIVSNDPMREERDDSFSKAYLKTVKTALKDNLPKYIEFLKVLNDFTDEKEPDMVGLYHNVCKVLDSYSDLIEEFTAFLPQEIASQCGVLIPNLEFAKARLFLRQVEVYFRKQPTHFQKILSVIIEWGGKEDRTNQQLKDLILPQLKSQPHLKQEFSLLFPDNIPPESHMLDFEYITLGEDDNIEYDSFEEIEVSDSEEEKPLINKQIVITTSKKKKKKSGIRKKVKGDKKIDPWKGLNAELQYGTHSCKCNCHEKSLDLRVQRKVRHCAYCTAGVSRAELISSLKGLKAPTRRPISKSQLEMFDDNSNSIDGPAGKKSRGKAHRKRPKDGSEDDDGEDDYEDDEEEDYGSKGRNRRKYSEAVSHLSQMCDSLADTLNENVNTSDDEDDEDDLDKYTEDEDEEKDTEDDEKDTDDEKESCDDKDSLDDDDPDDDFDEEELDYEEDDIPDDMDIDDGVETGEDAEDEDEDDDEEEEEEDDEDGRDAKSEVAVTSGESRDGVANSPDSASQDSIGSNSSHSVSPDTPQSEHDEEQKHQKKEVDQKDANSQLEIQKSDEQKLGSSKEDSSCSARSNEQLKSTKEVDQDITSERTEGKVSSSKTVPKDVQRQDKTDFQDQNALNQNADNVPSNVQSHTDTFVEKEEATKPSKTTDSKDDSDSQEISDSKVDKNVVAEISEQNRTVETIVEQNDKDSTAANVDHSKRSEPKKDDVKDGDEDKAENMRPGSSSDEQREKNIQGAIVTWTRDDDRLLLQSCQERDPSESLFVELAAKLGDKNAQQVSSRFRMLMQIFNSSQEEDDGDDDESDDYDEEHVDGDDEEEENDSSEEED